MNQAATVQRNVLTRISLLDSAVPTSVYRYGQATSPRQVTEIVRATLSGIRRNDAAGGNSVPRDALLTADIVGIVAATRTAVTG